MPDATAPGPQKRALFFVFDGGTGLGHLRRLSAIARALQGRFACLIVTSHRAAAHWFVPAECEYVHVPAWDSLIPERAAYWGREPFLAIDAEGALAFRKRLLRGIVESFRPDAIFVDHLPLGMRDELEDIVREAPCLKYLVTRGVQNETEDLARLLLSGKARDALERDYHRILVAIDREVFDIQERYDAFGAMAHKLCYTGYVAEPADPGARDSVRRARGVAAGDIWAVASAGGGQHGESLIAACCGLAALHPDIVFDVVIGPRSSLSRDALLGPAAAPNLRLHEEVSDMASLHAAADIVITSGGYNSLLETLRGQALIICVPNRKSERDEQYAHAARLRRFASIELDLDPAHLPAMFSKVLASVRSGAVGDRRGRLDFGGAANIRRLVLADVGVEEEAAPAN
jgi:predicted glycosyltransferase